MSVYLKDGMVLLDSGLVATNTACCCGCSNCDPIADALFSPTCVDDDGNCWTGDRCSSEVPCQGEQVPCGSFYIVDREYCCNLDGSIGRLCQIFTFDPITCEGISDPPEPNCACDEPGERGDGTHQVSDPWVPCTTCTGLECGACCHGDGCWTTSLLECFNFGFTFHLGLSCDGVYCPV